MNWVNPLNTAYNVPNTLLLTFLGILGSYIGWLIINKIKLKVNLKFLYSLTPWVLLTSSIKVLHDYGLLNSIVFSSPWIYGIMAIFTTTFLLILYKFNRKKYWKISLFTGSVIFALTLFLIPIFKNPSILIYFLAFFLPWLLIFYTFYDKKRLSLVNFLTLSSQLYDANITFVEISYFGYLEKHVLSTAIIRLGGPWLFVLVKFISTVVLLYFVDRYIRDKRLSNYIKFLVILFGLLTGTRDLLRGLCMC